MPVTGSVRRAESCKAFTRWRIILRLRSDWWRSLGYFAEIGGFEFDGLTAVEVHDADLTNKGIPNTYVPFRNAHFLAIATSWAEVLGAVKDLYWSGLRG
jgi:7-cyano-7-deazaguanine synthase